MSATHISYTFPTGIFPTLVFYGGQLNSTCFGALISQIYEPIKWSVEPSIHLSIYNFSLPKYAYFLRLREETMKRTQAHRHSTSFGLIGIRTKDFLAVIQHPIFQPTRLCNFPIFTTNLLWSCANSSAYNLPLDDHLIIVILKPRLRYDRLFLKYLT